MSDDDISSKRETRIIRQDVLFFFFLFLHVKHSCKTLRIYYCSFFTNVKLRHRLGYLLVTEPGVPGSNRIQTLWVSLQA